MTKTIDKEWKCTDPDIQQYGRQISDNVFEFKDKDTEPTEIDLSDYKIDEIENIINSYGYTLFKARKYINNITELYGKDDNWVIAECIFETEQ